MPYNKEKKQQISIRIPHALWAKIEADYGARGESSLSKNDKIILILEKWQQQQREERERKTKGGQQVSEEKTIPPARSSVSDN